MTQFGWCFTVFFSCTIRLTSGGYLMVITSPINIINTNSFATVTCYAWISNAILFFHIHYRNVHHHWWCLLPIFDLDDMVIFPIACGLGNKRGADILHANMNYRLDVNISLAKLHILFSSVVFQNKAYPLNFLCLETLNIFFCFDEVSCFYYSFIR